MTFRQIVLKAVYPLLMLFAKNRKQAISVQNNPSQTMPPVSFYSMNITANDGTAVSLAAFSGKKILICNTASDCGYTAQYADLETLYRQYGDTLVVIGFPANDFKGQEPLDDAGIAQFCQLHFGVSFPLAQKSQVVKGPGQHPVFKWLTDPKQNGWCSQEPTWNFCKYLISETGMLEAFFAQNVSPLSDEVIGAVVK
ncbi:glutathione peroxidase [Sediminibacterium soli]|uniref:glutathione peroxidase n=1 Tax=Sediminibacterium soli TaxID=2698829 RepID=UPI00192A1C96|nr:glutathione peroxidase [Sediminibacterium soli]